jgi:hypothetical protein
VTKWQNAVQTASDCVLFDIKSFTGKIYQHCHIHALHDEVLRSFGKLKETASTDILGHSNTWWLSPLPAVEMTTGFFFCCESQFLFV